MTVVSPIEALRSTETRKKFGSPNGYGNIIFGFSFYGDDNIFAGIYRRRPTRRGVSIVKMRFYRPFVQRTEDQGIQRNKMIAAVSAWKALTDSQKNTYRQIANKKKRRGVDFFISQFLNT